MNSQTSRLTLRAVLEVIEQKSPFRYYGPGVPGEVSQFERGPFTCPHYHGEVNYHHGMCPATESLAERLVYIPLAPTFENREIEDVVNGVLKVAAVVL